MKIEESLSIFQSPWVNVRQEDCRFYHSFDLPDGRTILGDWDMRGKFDDYIGGISLAGKRVIDVGTASGFLSFEAEKRGAKVTSFDADDTRRYTRLPHANSLYKKNQADAIVEDNKWLDAVKRSYWFVHEATNSKNSVVYGNIFDIPAEVGTFDVAILGQLLVHNRSGIEILEAVSRSTSDYLIITEGVLDIEEPAARFLGRASQPSDFFSFWIYSPAFYYEIMGMLGFRCEKFQKTAFYCGHEDQKQDMELGTFVFRRGS